MLRIVTAIISAFLCAHIAGKKGRSQVGWLITGLLGGVFGLILILLLSKTEAQKKKEFLKMKEREKEFENKHENEEPSSE